MLQINLAENLQRASLNPIERGKAFRRLMQLEDLNASEVAARMNVTISMVSRDLSLLDLPESLQRRVAMGELPASVGAHIARIDDDETRRALAQRYDSGELTRDGVAREIKNLSRPKGSAAKPQRLAVKLAGLSVSVAGKQLTIDALLGVFTRICKEAKSLKDGGKTDVTALAEALRAP